MVARQIKQLGLYTRSVLADYAIINSVPQDTFRSVRSTWYTHAVRSNRRLIVVNWVSYSNVLPVYPATLYQETPRCLLGHQYVDNFHCSLLVPASPPEAVYSELSAPSSPTPLIRLPQNVKSTP